MIAETRTSSAAKEAMLEEKKAAFAGIYDRMAEKIYGYFLNQTENIAVSEDLTSTVFLRGLAFFINHEVAPHSSEKQYDPWISKIAANTMKNYWRDVAFIERNESGVTISERHDISKADPSPEEMIIKNEDRNEETQPLLKAIEKFPERHQNIIYYKHVLRLTNRKIGEITGQTEWAVKSAYHRITQKLKKELAPENIQKQPLTPRETEVLMIIKNGALTRKEIAKALGVTSQNAVAWHLRNIFFKLGVPRDNESGEEIKPEDRKSLAVQLATQKNLLPQGLD
jgi:RNA polymerase sigma factor (sigma-70 family)